MLEKRKTKKAYVDKNFCVACGVCQKICPVQAITIFNGVFAKVDFDKCVGCGKCAKACPASTIEIK
nr:4Fe-4S binding protein [Clostridium vincentii]